MCHNSSIESEQIDRFVANGMPQKVIKSVKYTIRKRHKADNEKRRRREEEKEASSIAAATAAAPMATVTEMITETAIINGNNTLTETTATATKKDNTTIISATTTNATITQTTVNDLTNGLYEATTSSSTSSSFSSTSTSLSSCRNASKRNSSKVEVTKETTTVVAVTETIEEPTKGTELKLENFLTAEKHNETKSENISKATNMQNEIQQQLQTQKQQENQTTNSNKTFQLLQKIPKFCGRYRPLLQQLQREQAEEAEQKLVTLPKVCDDEPATTTTTTAQLSAQRRSISVMDPKTLEPSMDDALAIGTQMTRKFAERLASAVGKLQCSKLYTILTRTTQPAHLIAICILAFVMLTVGPDLIENHNGSSDNHGLTQIVATATQTTTTTTSNNKAPTATTTTTATSMQNGGGGGGSLATIAYLAAFATHFGAQIWMTFVSGLSLYFSLPRHTFGQCQQILFPKYFALNAMLSIVMLIIYVKYFFSNWTFAAILQLTSLALTAIIEVTVRLYLAPPMLRLMHEKYKIEDAIGSGQEVGSLVQGDLVQCPHYQRIHKGFRRIHMTIAIGNMIVMLATFLHLYFLASKIRIS